MLGSAPYRKLIDAAADVVGLPKWEDWTPGVWLEGLIMTESSGNPKATRYEPHQDRIDRRDRDTDGDTPGVDDGTGEDDKSYGLMQVMGYNVRTFVGVKPGTPMDFSWVCTPIAGIAMGLRVLLGELRATGGNVERALARYNGGPTGERMVETGHGLEMRCQGYVRLVRRNADLVARDRGL